jgi:hypothetical protein
LLGPWRRLAQSPPGIYGTEITIGSTNFFPHTDALHPKIGMLTNVMERSLEVGKTVDVVKHILAIAERERRKRALKKAPDQPSPRPVALGKNQEQCLKKGSNPWTR